MNRAAKTYAFQFSAAMSAYTIVLILAMQLLRVTPPASLWRAPIALLPVIPVGFALAAYVRFLSRSDELQQRINLQALAFAFGATALLTFTYGFLEIAGFPQLSWIWVLPLMIGLWGLAMALYTRKYQ